MGVTGRSNAATKRDDGSGGIAGAFWLVRWELGTVRPPYELGALLYLLFGFLAVPILYGVFEFGGMGLGGSRMEGFFNDFLADAYFLVVCAFLGVGVLGRRDAISSRLLFLRGLPIPVGSVVAWRAVSMLSALAANAAVFFSPAFLFSAFGDLGASYLWFEAIWVGYGLLASGLYLILELSANGRARITIFVGFVLSLVLAAALIEWTASPGLVGRTVDLTRNNGALPAVFSVVGGAAAFILLARVAVRRVRSRDVFWESSS